MSPTRLAEIEQIEGDDQHHDFGGPHGSKGHDFAHFWLIVRILEVEKDGYEDYMFVCEYVQDIAEFDSGNAPAQLVLYQLKKREGASDWTPASLTGQTNKNKAPKSDRPVCKLFRSVKAFKSLKARGVFVSDGRFDVSLASGESSVNNTTIKLNEWDDPHCQALRTAFAELDSVEPDQVDLTRLELRRVALHVDDLQRHTNGIMFDFLSSVAPEHVNQAASLVDSIYVRIKANARRTEKCKSWDELVERRGFGKAAFQQAVAALSAIPDRPTGRHLIFEGLSQAWSGRRKLRVLKELTRCATERIVAGKANRWQIDRNAVEAVIDTAEASGGDDQQVFEQVCIYLATVLPHLGPDEISALAIFEMTEVWNQSPTPV